MQLSVREAVTESIERVSRMCERTFGIAPPFHLEQDGDVRISYIPAHLDYMLDEVLKNASRAVVERHSLDRMRYVASNSSSGRDASVAALPPIVIQICAGADELTIKVSHLSCVQSWVDTCLILLLLVSRFVIVAAAVRGGIWTRFGDMGFPL